MGGPYVEYALRALLVQALVDLRRMEVRIDTVEGQEPPSDTFVSVRIGDVQKQSRFTTTRTYRFPDPGDGRGNFGRLEVFKRIGHITVSFDNMKGEDQFIEVPCDLPDIGFLPMKLAVTGPAAAAAELPPIAKKGKAKARLDAAQKYLAEHRLEEILADAMREVIHEKPSDPHSFLSAMIMKHANPKGTLLPRLNASAERVQPEKSAPLRSLTGEKLPPISSTMRPEQVLARELVLEPAPEVQDLSEKKLKACKALLESARDGTLAAALAEVVGTTAEVVRPCNMRPSVGSWLVPRLDPGQPVTVRPTVDPDIESLRLQARAALFKSLSDGTLAKVLAASAEPPKAAPAPVVVDEVEQLRIEARDALLRSAKEGTLASLLSQGKGQSDVEALRKQARDVLLAAAQNGTLQTFLVGQKKAPEYPPGFRFKPSVGSWLAKKPIEVPRPWYYKKIEVKVEDDEQVMKELQDVIAQKDAEIEMLKATLRSSGLLSLASSSPSSTIKNFNLSSTLDREIVVLERELKVDAAVPPAPKPKPPTVAAVPFKDYFTKNMLSVDYNSLNLYSKFHSRPTVAQKAIAKALPSAPFSLRPSVGTWLMPVRKGVEVATVKSTSTATKSAVAVAPKPFHLRASVGTWLGYRNQEEERPKSVSILTRSDSMLKTMKQEELITGFQKEIHRRDEEIEKLRRQLNAA